jgi:DDE superfamily endonuclease
MVLVRMAKGDTFAQLGAHFGVATDTAWRYVNEGVDALDALAPTLREALAASHEERRLLLDGTLLPTWRCDSLATEANPDPLHSGKHRDHGMNVQALATPACGLLGNPPTILTRERVDWKCSVFTASGRRRQELPRHTHRETIRRFTRSQSGLSERRSWHQLAGPSVLALRTFALWSCEASRCQPQFKLRVLTAHARQLYIYGILHHSILEENSRSSFGIVQLTIRGNLPALFGKFHSKAIHACFQRRARQAIDGPCMPHAVQAFLLRIRLAERHTRARFAHPALKLSHIENTAGQIASFRTRVINRLHSRSVTKFSARTCWLSAPIHHIRTPRRKNHNKTPDCQDQRTSLPCRFPHGSSTTLSC